MAKVETHDAGSFCWVELGTTDQDAAKRFYGALFGWKADDSPVGPGRFYTMFSLEGRYTGACYTLEPEMLSHGVPPHWLLYVSVANVDEAADKAARAGGTVAAGPLDVSDFGRMAVVRDPAGAHFGIWQPKTHIGTGIEGVPGTLCWADLITPDRAAAARFYQALFGWQAEPAQHGYLRFKNGERPIGGSPDIDMAGVPPHWAPFFFVRGCAASAAGAQAAGAKVCVEPTAIEGIGRWSTLSDPQGAFFTLFEPAR